jgi:hypothetical protein
VLRVTSTIAKRRRSPRSPRTAAAPAIDMSHGRCLEAQVPPVCNCRPRHSKKTRVNIWVVGELEPHGPEQPRPERPPSRPLDPTIFWLTDVVAHLQRLIVISSGYAAAVVGWVVVLGVT